MIVGSYMILYVYTYFTCDVTCFLQQEKLDDHETAGRNEAWLSSGLALWLLPRVARGGSFIAAGGSKKYHFFLAGGLFCEKL
jgi:hypothetical protein